nr:PQQ-dependent sugar dehydrogenase [Chitinophagaceae bacterium]
LLDHYQRNAITRYEEAGGAYIVAGRSGATDPASAVIADIRKAANENKPLDYSKVSTLKTPPEEQFTKTRLKLGGFYEPTEMTILPNLDVLIAQRRGEILLYKHDDTALTQAGYLHVYHQSAKKGVNAEEGLLGIKIDPDFASNHFVYVLYSPADTSVNRLSRFTFVNNKIDSASEKIILQFYSQRNICCHTGGSIAFGKDHLLFVSAGDNSTPFNEPNQKYTSRSYAPLDERPGHEQYDARRSAGNTNDLRGKILRIKIRPDGTYDIPDGNLFPKGTEKTKPEIYVMGDRNPYRISVDQKNGYLYWGEVGPDANTDSAGRGPRGYDEVNQARTAGYFGWPLFVGNNYPYSEYDYATGKMGMTFDPAKPVNNSRNNTGLKVLPPAHPAFIWYPYAVSPDFPQIGSGGRNAMAGPVFYSSVFGTKGIPAYYDGKLFIYDFIRGWIKAVTMKPNGDFDHMEPFMPHIKMNSAIDMEMGPDGHIYVLEYGTGWFTQNADAGLYRIDYDSTAKAKPIVAVVNEPKPALDSAELKQGHQELDDITLGMNIMDRLDCKTCHKTDGKSIGPAFTEVAKKYPATDKNINYLVKKIQNGGSGVWGEVAMPAHPALPSDDGKKIVAWIMSLKKK